MITVKYNSNQNKYYIKKWMGGILRNIDSNIFFISQCLILYLSLLIESLDEKMSTNNRAFKKSYLHFLMKFLPLPFSINIIDKILIFQKSMFGLQIFLGFCFKLQFNYLELSSNMASIFLFWCFIFNDL